MLRFILIFLGLGFESLGPIPGTKLWWVALARNSVIIGTLLMVPLAVIFLTIWFALWAKGVDTHRFFDMAVLTYPFITAIMALIGSPLLVKGHYITALILNWLPAMNVIIVILFLSEHYLGFESGVFSQSS